ncbi:MAG: helicase-related protein [Planctomycetota bacterium]
MTDVSEPKLRFGETRARHRTLAAGARVRVRGEEWLVRSVKQSSDGTVAVHVTGLSELVRQKDAIFLEALDTIEELRPEETDLASDDTPRYRRSRLYLETLLRRTPPASAAITLGHLGAMKRTNYQLQPTVKALSQLRPRILLADGVGLGKTIEVGVLLTELIERGRGDRILVVALKSILAQFQEELWARFTIPLVRLDSVGIQRVQSKIPSNMNPFYHFDRVIISIDTLKKDAKYRRYLEACRWDAVVIDECQNVAIRTRGGQSSMAQRARLAQLLAAQTDALILTSATPHDGSSQSFASLVRLLEPTAIADENDYGKGEVEDYFLRRFKKDIKHEVEGDFPERELELKKVEASPEEDAVFEALDEITFQTIDRRATKGRGILFRTGLLKAFLSSPAACLETIEHRLKHKDVRADNQSAAHDREVLTSLQKKLKPVDGKAFGKYQKLLERLRSLGFDEKKSTERIVIFSERLATLRFLQGHLTKDLGLAKDALETFHGSLDDQKQQGLVKSFGSESSPVRILLASDAASEGINLHFFCHRMIHFDLPWSLITLEQRNGRIDRFGQRLTPELTYLLTIPSNPRLQGDLRVLERLIEKEQSAHLNLGDVAWLMKLHDPELEEERVAKAIEEHEAPEDVLPDQDDTFDFMQMLLGDGQKDAHAVEIAERLRLYPGDLDFARDAFEEIEEVDEEHLVWHDHLDGFELSPTPDLLRRFDYLPPELRQNDTLKLTADRDRVMKALEDSREDENRWPEWQLFWEQHPVAEWLDDRVLGAFAAHEAPVLRMARGIEPGQRYVLIQGQVSNGRSQPVLVEWFAVRFEGDRRDGIEPFAELARRTGLTDQTANPGGELVAHERDALKELLPEAVAAGREHLDSLRNQRAATLSAPLREGLSKLRDWKDKRLALLDERRAKKAEKGSLRKDEKRRLEDERQHVERLYDSRRQWIEEGMRTNPEPYLRVAAILVPHGRGA